MNPSIRGMLPGLVVPALCVLGLITGGIGLALCLLAITMIAATLQTWVPCMAGPVRWAATAILFALYAIGSSWLPTLVTNSSLTGKIALPVLALPSIICAGLLLWARRLPSREARRPAGLGRGVVSALSLGVVALPALARFGGSTAEFVWAMSGDARNHLIAVRAVIDAGGLTLGQLRAYPFGIHGLTAMNAAASGRGNLSPAQLLEGDIRSLAGSWILAALGVAVLSATAVLLSLPRDIRESERLPVPVSIVVTGAGVLAGTGLFSGVALLDGFLPAFAGEALILAGVVVAIQALQHPHPLLGALILGDVVVLMAYRPILAPVVLALLFVVMLRVRQLRRWDRGWWVIAVPALTLGGAFGLYVITRGRTQLRLSLEAPGAIAAPSMWMLAALVVLVIAVMLGPRSSGLKVTAVPPLVVMGLVFVLIALSEIWDPAPGLSYSSAKLVWAGCIVGAWMIFAVIARWVALDIHRDSHRELTTGVARATAWSLAALLGIAAASPTSTPVDAIVRGWIRPTPEVIDVLLSDLDEGPVVVPWLYAQSDPDVPSPSFGDDILGVFWSMTQWDPTLYEQMYGWSYSLTDGNAESLCPLVDAVPRVVVVTRDPGLEARVRAACGVPGSRARFIVEPR